MERSVGEIITPEHLGYGATEETVEQFERACDIAQNKLRGCLKSGFPCWECAIEYVWNQGDFAVRIKQLLGEEVITSDQP